MFRTAPDMRSLILRSVAVVLMSGAALAQTLTPFRAPDVWQRFTAHSFSQGPNRFVPDGQGGMMFWFQQLDRVNDQLTGTPILLRGDGSVNPAFKPGTFAYSVGAVAPAPGGRWIVAYSAPNASVVARLRADGSPDPTFAPKGFSQGIRFLTPLPDNTLLVVVSGNLAGNPHPDAIDTPLATVVKLRANGDLDPAFNRPALTNFPFLFAPPLLDSQGRFILGGTFNTTGAKTLSNFARYLPDGTLDPSFGGSTTLPTSLGGVVRGLGFQSDGKLVVVGDIRLPAGNPGGAGTNRFVALRFDANGTHDPSFKLLRHGEIQTTDFPRMLVIQPDDKVVLSATGLRRLNADGSFDTTFKNAVTAPTFWVGALADGRLMLPGGSPERGVSVFSADGEPDLTFDVRGFGSSVSTSFAPLADGRVALSGTFNRVGTQTANGILLLDTNGVPVPGFPGVGQLAPSAKVEAQGNSLDVAASGSDGLLVGGSLADGTGSPAFSGVKRLRLDGTVDTAFAGLSVPPESALPAKDGSLWIGGLTAQEVVSLTPAGATAVANPGAWLSRLDKSGSAVTGLEPLAADLVAKLSRLNRQQGILELGGVSFLSLARSGGVYVELTTVDGAVMIRRLSGLGVFQTGFAPPTISGNQPAQDFPSVTDPVTGNTFQLTTFEYSGVVRIAAELADGALVIGGRFTQFPGAAPGPLALLRPDGSVETGFVPQTFTASRPFAVPSVLAVAVDAEDRIYVAGNFDRYGATAVPGLVRLNRQGRLDPTFTSPLTITDYPQPRAKLQLVGSTLWVGGSFRGPGETFPRTLWKLDLGPMGGVPPINWSVSGAGLLLLNWPSLPGIGLEVSNDLSGNGNWRSSTLTVTQTGGDSSVTVPAASQPEFYRLRRAAP